MPFGSRAPAGVGGPVGDDHRLLSAILLAADATFGGLQGVKYSASPPDSCLGRKRVRWAVGGPVLVALLVRDRSRRIRRAASGWPELASTRSVMGGNDSRDGRTRTTYHRATTGLRWAHRQGMVNTSTRRRRCDECNHRRQPSGQLAGLSAPRPVPDHAPMRFSGRCSAR